MITAKSRRRQLAEAPVAALGDRRERNYQCRHFDARLRADGPENVAARDHPMYWRQESVFGKPKYFSQMACPAA